MLSEPNFPVRFSEFVGRRSEIDEFREALRHGLAAGRTSSFAILGEWGIGKSSLLWKFADLSSEPAFAMLPICLSASTDIPDYLRFAEILLDKFAEALLSHPNMQCPWRTELQDWRIKRAHLGAVAFERESPPRFLSTGSTLLRHMLTEAWDHFLRPAGLKGAIFFVDDLQNITSISKSDLALILRDQFQWFGIEMLNYSMCFSAKADFFAGTKALADPALRFYTKLYLEPFTFEEIVEYTRPVLDLPLDTAATVAAWLQEKTLGDPYFLACVCKHLSATMSRIVPQTLERMWPAILGQLGRERFCQDLSRLSAKELELIHQFASLGDGEFAPQRFGSPCSNHRADSISFTHCGSPLPLSIPYCHPSLTHDQNRGKRSACNRKNEMCRGRFLSPMLVVLRTHSPCPVCLQKGPVVIG
ncbi:MAG TPA: ATP-binding protein [Candidatus Sulfotelmatobacter sp.]|nr:ATP-binding protein [Candidatus Sulfotelmatobacter sp.]HUI75540.1 ATP-binding protein [Candidatus Acidoferrum sp.]